MSFTVTGKFQIQPTTLFPLWNSNESGGDTGTSIKPLGFVMNQNRMSVPVWSYAMEQYPPARIIEIGSYNGGFACALGVHAHNIGAQVYGLDVHVVPGDEYKSIADFLGVKFYTMDCFSSEGREFILGLLATHGTAYLLCDGGNKMREITEFAPYLKTGDVIAAHDYYVRRDDWWPFSETHKELLEDIIREHHLEPFYQKYFDIAGWLAFRKVK